MSDRTLAARYLRQIILSEVGREGQRRIAQSMVRLDASVNDVVLRWAQLYAERMGFASVKIEAGGTGIEETTPSTVVPTLSCRDAVDGARLAARLMRQGIEGRADSEP